MTFWVSWVYYFAAMSGLLILIPFSLQKFPSFKDERKLNMKIIKKLLSKKMFLDLNLCIALYVGVEVGFGSWLVEYLRVNNSFKLSQMSAGMFATILALATEKFPRYSGVITGVMAASAGIGGAIFPNIIGRMSDIGKWGLKLGLGSCALYLLGIFIIILIITRDSIDNLKEKPTKGKINSPDIL